MKGAVPTFHVFGHKTPFIYENKVWGNRLGSLRYCPRGPTKMEISDGTDALIGCV